MNNLVARHGHGFPLPCYINGTTMLPHGPDEGPADARLRHLETAMRAFAEATTDYDRLLTTIAEQVAGVVGDGCAVTLLSEDGKALVPRAVAFNDPDAMARGRAYLGEVPTIAEGTSAIADVVREGRAQLIPEVDLAELAPHVTSEYLSLLRDMNIRKLLRVPLLIQRRAIGLVTVLRTAQSAPFSDEDQTLARSLSEHAALAIANAQLFRAHAVELVERRRAEQEARQFADLVQHSKDFIGMAGLDGKILFVNDAGRKLVGLDPDQDLNAISLPDLHTAEGMRRAPVLRETGHWEGEGQLRHIRTGELIDVHVSSFLVKSPDGKPLCFATLQRDMRETKRKDAHLRQLKTLSAMGQLVAGVAHEVRNPLFSMTAALDAMEALFKADASQKPFIEVLRREASRLSRLMSDLLSYGRPHEEPLSSGGLSPVFAQTVQACSILAANAGVEIQAHADPSIRLQMSSPRLVQVFQNLTENAIQHSPRGGRVQLEAAVRGPEGAFVECSVIDAGPGFSDEVLAHVFEPFFTRRPGGTGLGLSIVERIVVQHGGDVRAENVAGGGARVVVRLPHTLTPST